MNKNIIIAIAALGGLILIATLLPKTPEKSETDIPMEEKVTLPTEVASNFPTYPNAVISNSTETTGDDGRIFYSISLESKSTIAEINDWYREALSINGWNIKSDRNVGGYQIIQGEKDNLYTSMQAASAEDDKVTISQQARITP
jgi:hypothetical protein